VKSIEKAVRPFAPLRVEKEKVATLPPSPYHENAPSVTIVIKPPHTISV
jgi:hypothetical protein